MPRIPTRKIVSNLTEIFGESGCRTDEQSLVYYGCDWTRKFTSAPAAIVFPNTKEQVQQLVMLANEQQFALVPSGGRTGLSAGAVAANGEVVVSMEAMKKISNFNETDRTVNCQAGVVTQQLQQFAEQQGLFYPVDFASAGSSQIGGNIATNAGGIKVLRYGMTREWVASLTVVTGRGDLLSLNNGLVKNATGYDLRHLIIGSEGTLGIIVDATMRLARKPSHEDVLVLGVPQFRDIMNVLHVFQKQLDLTAFEFFSEQALTHVINAGHVGRPFEESAPFYALIEFEHSGENPLDTVTKLFEHCLKKGWAVDGVISQSESQKANLWRLREDISETIAHYTPYKNDLSVIVSRVPEFIDHIDQLVTRRYPEFEVIWFGHIGDGNVHLNILKPSNMDKNDFFAKCESVNDEIFEVVEKFRGSISAEHGVGMTKRPYLHYSRSAEEIEIMKSLKQVFDPKGVMNPGKLV